MKTTKINDIYYSEVPRWRSYKIKNTILEKVRRYITPSEIDFYEKEWKGLPWIHIDEIDRIRGFLIEQFGDLPIEPIVLACIVFEMDIYYYRVGKDKWFREDSINEYLNGAYKFFELISENSKNQTVTRITFEIMQPRNQASLNKDEMTSDNIPQENQSLKGKIQAHIIVEGTEVIQLIMDSVSKSKNEFSHLAERESRDENTVKRPLYKDPRNHLKKIYADILYRYLKDHLPNNSHNLICEQAGTLLDSMHLFLKRKTQAQDSPKRKKQFLVSNTKSALSGKIS